MELSYRDLAKKDVINISDGRCLGRIIDMKFKFPQGVIIGIVVPGQRTGIFRCFNRTEIYIDESKIIKIGGDVILVDLKCNDTFAPSVKLNRPSGNNKIDKPPECPPPCSPACPPACPPSCPPNRPQHNSNDGCFNLDLSDLEDY